MTVVSSSHRGPRAPAEASSMAAAHRANRRSVMASVMAEEAYAWSATNGRQRWRSETLVGHLRYCRALRAILARRRHRAGHVEWCFASENNACGAIIAVYDGGEEHAPLHRHRSSRPAPICLAHRSPSPRHATGGCQQARREVKTAGSAPRSIARPRTEAATASRLPCSSERQAHAPTPTEAGKVGWRCLLIEHGADIERKPTRRHRQCTSARHIRLAHRNRCTEGHA